MTSEMRAPAFGAGRGSFGPHGALPGERAERIGWATPFSEGSKNGLVLSHYLVGTAHYREFAYRLCLPGEIVNRALLSPASRSARHCLHCERILRAMAHRQMSAEAAP